MKLPKLPQFVARLLAPITSRIQAYKDKKIEAANQTAKKAADQADKQLIAELLTDVPEADAPFVRPCLENQLAYINQEVVARGAAGTIGNKRVTMLLAKRMMQHILQFRGIVGIQPIQSPAGLVYSLQYRSEPYEGGQSNFRLEVVSNAVAAYTRKLQARYNIEAVQDLTNVHDIDFETEIVSALASECVEEYARQIVHDLCTAGPEMVVTGENGPYIDTAINNVIVTIAKAANSIAVSNRRGPGNVLVMSPTALAILSTSKFFPFVEETSGGENYTISLRKAGYIGASSGSGMQGRQYTVYVSLDPSLSQDGKETIIVGYKGGSGEVDAAYIISPYIPVIPSGPVVDPLTFSPQINLMTRFAQYVADGKDNELYDVKNYYRTVTFNLGQVLGSVVEE